MARLRFGIDVGGTFTDVVAQDDADGRLTSLKVPTVPERQEQSVVAGIDGLLGKGAAVTGIVHGTTVVTNAILEGRGARVALLTTRGFRDVLEIGRQNRDSLYDLERPGRREPLVPRHRRFEVDERTTFDGRILRPLREGDLATVAARVRASEAEAVAICLLHAYANPEHELAAANALRDAAPYVCTSSEINAEFREYERTSTVVLNALVMPIIDRYIAGLARGLSERGHDAPLHIVQSSGGMLSSDVTRRQPLRMVMSGPAAGVAASRYLLCQLELTDAVTFDMGGTSTDVCLIAGGQVETVRERKIDGLPLRAPSVAVQSIGAGGGSVAWVDPVGALKVGPRSAGARPGPAAYGLGGQEPTVTDANVALGYIRPELVFGGEIRIDRDRACRAIERFGGRLGLGLFEAAHGILEIADASMMRAIRLVSVQKGYDLRFFGLVAYGGAGPLHAGRLARALGIPRVIVPAHSSVFSAFGCLVSDLRYDSMQTYRARLSTLDPEEVERRFRRLEDEALVPLLADGCAADEISLLRRMDLRYAGQNYELEVPVERGLPPAAIKARFNEQHRARYTYDTDEDVETVNLRVVATIASRIRRPAAQPARDRAEPIAEHEAFFRGVGVVRTPVYARAGVGVEPLAGPAIVEDEQSTVLVLPGQCVAADRLGNLVLDSADGRRRTSDRAPAGGNWGA